MKRIIESLQNIFYPPIDKKVFATAREVVVSFPGFFYAQKIISCLHPALLKWGRVRLFLPLFLLAQPDPLFFRPGSYSWNVSRFSIRIVPLFLLFDPLDELQKHPVQVVKHDRNNSPGANLAIKKPRNG